MGTYLIIGASSGIGKALAGNLSQKKHNVIGTYNKTKPSENASPVKYIHYDVLSDSSLSLEIDQLDGLVYCPGAINLKPFSKIQTNEFEHDFQLQVLGAIKIIQQCTPLLKKSTNASIVLFSTVAVQHGFPYHTMVSVSKGAIEGLTKALAAELSPSIRVNAIAPSLTNTPLAKSLLNSEEKIQLHASKHPLKRIGSPNDIASLAEFLLSESSSWITGQIISVDGGMSTLKI